ncbi:MAG: EamA family transporter [Gallionellales bacterium 35-53-114]|jgi:drug/metabolite transporter (DMT)-like permease|nr:MAG: EamA family transporter [Gallionellales bacterium 35-53-114]OYZ63676.1 MAG: EamA family transporter [Gallionellales bacterium 24-53-125]OZB09491.1 MAG: EamA family transporter [Gallionellales bacterium 39-52-133]HQS57842.1 DMT family transporter [Gallionellaceae bacterium]HQS76003.1 DMT family transporter [Gallionellaceae bacterium]
MGALWMLVAGFLFGCMGVFVKLGAEYFSNIELVFYRSFIGLIIMYAIVRQRGGSIATPHWLGHLWRGLSGSIALLLFFYCITVLPLATAVTLNYTSPLFLTVLLMLVLKERFHAPLVIAIMTGFAGMLLLLHPTLERDQLVPGLLGLISGFFAGIAMLNVRELGRSGEPEWRTVFYFSLIATLISGAMMLFDTIHEVTPHNALLLLGMGSCATLAQLALTRAYSTGRTLVASSLSYSAVVFATLFGIVLWGEVLSLDSWVGMALIIASGIASLKLSPRH